MSPLEKNLIENIKYYHDRTPAQQASFLLNRPLESQFVFLDKDFFSLNSQLDALQMPNRPGVFMMPLFPVNFSRMTFDRQEFMTTGFVADSNQVNQVKGIWYGFAQMRKSAPPMPETELAAILKSVKTATDKIKARGGEIVFVRTPSSGDYLNGEKMGFPREKYWDRLLAYTNCAGIHFEDYPAIDHFVCPEFSHLSQPDAVIFTKHLIEILANDKGWKGLNSKK